MRREIHSRIVETLNQCISLRNIIGNGIWNVHKFSARNVLCACRYSGNEPFQWKHSSDQKIEFRFRFSKEFCFGYVESDSESVRQQTFAKTVRRVRRTHPCTGEPQVCAWRPKFSLTPSAGCLNPGRGYSDAHFGITAAPRSSKPDEKSQSQNRKLALQLDETRKTPKIQRK